MDEKDIILKMSDAENVIHQRIFIIRGYKVMFDKDLAELYGISTGRFNEQAKRNIERFPGDFAFQLTVEEFESLRSQFAISNVGRGGRRHVPYAFTEHGVSMLSAILNSKQAILMSIFIVRAFIKMRESLDNYKDLALKMGELESNQIKDHSKLNEVYCALQRLISNPIKSKGKLGFN